MTQIGADVSKRDEPKIFDIRFNALNTSVSSTPKTICGHL
jgi:hypothetical protein